MKTKLTFMSDEDLTSIASSSLTTPEERSAALKVLKMREQLRDWKDTLGYWYALANAYRVNILHRISSRLLK